MFVVVGATCFMKFRAAFQSAATKAQSVGCAAGEGIASLSAVVVRHVKLVVTKAAFVAGGGCMEMKRVSLNPHLGMCTKGTLCILVLVVQSVDAFCV